MGSFYVDGISGNDANAGWVDYPFKTVQRAIDACIDDDFIWVKPANYTENLTVLDKRIYFGKWPGFSGEISFTGTGTWLTYTDTTADNSKRLSCFSSGSAVVELFGFSKIATITASTTATPTLISRIGQIKSSGILEVNNSFLTVGLCDFQGVTFECANYGKLHIVQSDIRGATFVHNSAGNYTTECLWSLSSCDARGAEGLFLPQKTIGYGALNFNILHNTQVTICDVSGDGVSAIYSEGGASNNNCYLGIDARFTNSPTATWADINAIPFATCIYLSELQAKADLDLGAGVCTVHVETFQMQLTPPAPPKKKHELNPRIPNAQGGIPYQTNYIRYSTVPRFSRRECKFEIDSKKAILTNGLISSVPSTIGGTTALQATAANQPQKGYFDTAVFNAATVPDGLVSTWANTNNGGLGGYGWGALSQANDSLRPTKSAGEITFNVNEYLSMSEIAAVHNAISIEVYVWIDTVASVTTFKQAHLSYAGNTYIAVTFNPTLSSYYVEYVVGNGATVVYCLKFYASLAEFNANLTGRWLHIVGVYNGSKAYLYIDSLLVDTQLYSNAINVPSGVFAMWCSVNGIPWRIRYSKVFKTGLSAAQVALAYANRNTYNYQLPRQGIGTESGDFLSINTLQSLTLQNISAFTWVNVNSGISLATNTLYPFISNLSGNYGFEFGIRTATTTASFYLKIGNGAAVDTFYFDALAFASFAAKYFGKWIYLGFSFGPIKRFYVGAVNFAYTTSHISIVTTANNVLLLKGETGTAPTGTLIELAMLLERCINQVEVNEKIRVDKDSHSWLR